MEPTGFEVFWLRGITYELETSVLETLLRIEV